MTLYGSKRPIRPGSGKSLWGKKEREGFRTWRPFEKLGSSLETVRRNSEARPPDTGTQCLPMTAYIARRSRPWGIFSEDFWRKGERADLFRSRVTQKVAMLREQRSGF